MENENVNLQNEDNSNENNSVVFTDEQKAIINKMIQSESDRRVDGALKKQKQKYEKQLSLSNLDGTDRQLAEKDDTIAELQEQLAEFNRIKVQNEVKTVLSDRGLNPKFADLLMLGDDVETSQQVISEFDKLFKQAVKVEVEKKFSKGDKPKVGTRGLDGEVTKEQFRKMSLSEKHEIKLNNPTLYNTLIGR